MKPNNSVQKLESLQITELERTLSTLPSECKHDSDCCNVVGDAEMLSELESFINTCHGVNASKTAIHEFGAGSGPTDVVAICGAITAIAGAMAAYVQAKKRKFRVKHDGKEYEFVAYTEKEVTRMLRLFNRVILKRK